MRITSVEWIRIFAAFVVIMYHFESLYFGEHTYFEDISVVVDFFFMLSGFLLMKSAIKVESASQPEALVSSLKFSLNKAKGFYLAYITAFFMVFILNMVMAQNDFGEVLLSLFHFKWEAVLLQMAAFNPDPQFGVDYLVGSAWYLSAMLLAMIPVYYLATQFRKAFLNFIAPLAIIFIYGFIMQEYGTLNIGNEVLGFMMSGNLRAFAGLSLGCVAYAIYTNISDKDWSKKSLTLSNILETICVISLPLLVILQDYITSYDALLWIFIFAILIIFGFTNKTVISKFFNTHLTRIGTYLGKLSLYLYLFHWFFVVLFQQYFQGFSYFTGSAIYLICVFGFSALTMPVFEKFKGGNKL